MKTDYQTATARLSRQFLEFFEKHSAQGMPLALISVIETIGSTYSKRGHQVLVDENGNLVGLVSGGCLESDLAARAAQVIVSEEAENVTYDLTSDDDVFGLGVGCKGTLHLRLSPLIPGNDYEPLASIVAALEQRGYADVPLDPGATTESRMLRLLAPPELLILGAGPDAAPLVKIVDALGWRASIYDHRQHYLDGLDLPTFVATKCQPADALGAELELSEFDAAIVMSHHLNSDREYLRALAASTIPFVGLLGPPHRRDRLVDELGDAGGPLRGRLRAPVGRRIGGRGPAAIALEVAAELQSFFSASEEA